MLIHGEGGIQEKLHAILGLCAMCTILSVCVRVCVAFAISSECRSVCVALVAGAGRRCTYTVCTFYN